MIDLKMVNNAKEMIKNAVQVRKIPWTPRAQAVLKSAEKQARKNGFDLVGTEHIFFGIVSVKDCLGSIILKNLGADEARCVELYEKMCKTTKQNGVGKTKLSKDIGDIIKYAYEQANEWGHEYIGAEHLLVGILLAGEGAGYQMLTDLEITLEKVREETQKLIVCRNVKDERREK